MNLRHIYYNDKQISTYYIPLTVGDILLIKGTQYTVNNTYLIENEDFRCDVSEREMGLV